MCKKLRPIWSDLHIGLAMGYGAAYVHIHKIHFFLYLLQIPMWGGSHTLLTSHHLNSRVWPSSSFVFVFVFSCLVFLIWCCLLFKRLRKICMNLTSCSVKQNKGSIRKCSEKTKSVGKHTRSVGKYSALEYKSMESMGHIHQGERSSLEKWTCWIDMYKCIYK